jgi:hypothetical protein
LIPDEHGKNQNPEQRDYGENISSHEAPVLALDPLLYVAQELGWRLRDAAPLFPPNIKFAVFDHSLTPIMASLPARLSELF